MAANFGRNLHEGRLRIIQAIVPKALRSSIQKEIHPSLDATEAQATSASKKR
jgi:hypothetical protein